MKSLTRLKVKGRRDSHSFFAFPHQILESKEYTQLSAIAVKLLLDICVQFRGENNGDLCTAWKLMRKRGWKSRDTLFKAQHELENNGWIERTRQGGKNKANLFAITWRPIDECKGKLDVKPTKAPSNKWKKIPDTDIGLTSHGYRVNDGIIHG